MGTVLFLARVGQKIFDTRRSRVPPGPGIDSPSYAREAGASDVAIDRDFDWS